MMMEEGLLLLDTLGYYGGSGVMYCTFAGAFGSVCRPHQLGGTSYTTGHIATA